MNPINQSIRRCVFWVTLLAIAPFGLSSLTGQEPLGEAEQKNNLLKRMEVIAELGKTIPRHTFDPLVIVEQCERDPDKLFTWVRDQTYLIPYQGLLRGHLGVLMDRRGNSLDRALLLAELLRLSGKEVRLANARLSDDLASMIRDESRPYPEEGIDLDSTMSKAQFVSQLRRFEAIPGLNHRELLAFAEGRQLKQQRQAETTIQRVIEQTPQLAAMANGFANPTPREDVIADQLADLCHHWWIQFKHGDAWVDADPALPNASVGVALVPPDQIVAVSDNVSTLADAIDAELKHKIDLRVVVERWEAGHLHEAPVLEAALEPHRLIGQPISITHAPLDWPLHNEWANGEDRITAMKRLIAEQWEWFPVLWIGDEMTIQSSFTISGRVNADAKAALNPPPIAGAALGGLTRALESDVIDQMRAGRKRPAQDRLTAEWIEYEIHCPGKPPRFIRRPVFDLIGPAARQADRQSVPRPDVTGDVALSRGLSVLGSTQLLPLTNHLSADFVRHLAVTRELKNLEPLLKLIDSEGAASQRLTPLPGLIHQYAIARQRWNLDLHRTYLDQLNLVTFRNSAAVDNEGSFRSSSGFDVLANPVAMHSSADGESFDRQLRQGVTDTVLEAVLLDKPAEVSNTSVLFERTSGNSSVWHAIDDADAPEFQQLDLLPDTRARIRTDLDNGFAVVVHDGGGADERTAVGWWRIDPATGRTLGMMGSGRGEGHVEYLIVTSLIFVCTAECVTGVTFCSNETPEQQRSQRSPPDLDDPESGEEEMKFCHTFRHVMRTNYFLTAFTVWDIIND